MTISSEPRRPMTTMKDRDDRPAIDPRILQQLNDEWSEHVRRLGRELELLPDTTPHGELDLHINGDLVPRAESIWNEHISNHLVRLWGLDRHNKGRARYSRDQFISAIFLFAARHRLAG